MCLTNTVINVDHKCDVQSVRVAVVQVEEMAVIVVDEHGFPIVAAVEDM